MERGQVHPGHVVGVAEGALEVPGVIGQCATCSGRASGYPRPVEPTPRCPTWVVRLTAAVASRPMVDYEERGRVAVFTINRPEAKNAVNGDVSSGLEAAIDKLEENPDVWIGVLAANPGEGERPVFCAGADLKAINEGRAHELATAKGGFAGYVYRERRKPVIVAVDGLATAGGCEIVLASDLVVATTRSSFGLAEVKRNLIAGAGGLFRLPKAIGTNVAMEMILTGEPLPAERAYQLGLVNRLVEPGQATDGRHRAGREDRRERPARRLGEPQGRARQRVGGRGRR